ncbi:MAG: ParB N-terminal domain-containing protein [Anaerolineae bacterium]|nr:ParB N-terminal domain-containing protein [Anaerolineae bacterium]
MPIKCWLIWLPSLASHPSQPRHHRPSITSPLARIRTDLAQPRKYLPDDLRQKFARGQATAQATLTTLRERAAQGDDEAHAYTDSIQLLANSIAANGLQNPIRLLPERETYTLVQGERRFWACVWLGHETIAAILVNTQANPIPAADALQRTRWAENVEREPVSAVDLADAICNCVKLISRGWRWIAISMRTASAPTQPSSHPKKPRPN